MSARSSDCYARAIAEVTVLLCDPEIACHPAGALASLQLHDLCREYVAARDRERAEERAIAERTAFYANRVAAALGRRAA